MKSHRFRFGGMTADSEEQEDELLALHSILDSEEFVQDESKAAGEIRVSVELPPNFTVALNEGKHTSLQNRDVGVIMTDFTIVCLQFKGQH